VTFDLDADATTAPVVTASQQGPLVVLRHVNHPCLLRDSGGFTGIRWLFPVVARWVGHHTLNIYPIRVSGKASAPCPLSIGYVTRCYSEGQRSRLTLIA
jgi:hypothetical protein